MWLECKGLRGMSGSGRGLGYRGIQVLKEDFEFNPVGEKESFMYFKQGSSVIIFALWKEHFGS